MGTGQCWNKFILALYAQGKRVENIVEALCQPFCPSLPQHLSSQVEITQGKRGRKGCKGTYHAGISPNSNYLFFFPPPAIADKLSLPQNTFQEDVVWKKSPSALYKGQSSSNQALPDT